MGLRTFVCDAPRQTRPRHRARPSGEGMRARPRLSIVASAIVVAAFLSSPRAARSHDVGVAGQRVVASVGATGKKQLKSTQKDPAVHFGPGSAASELSGTFELYFVDSPANRSTLPLPSPWLSNTGIVASFSNRLAP